MVNTLMAQALRYHLVGLWPSFSGLESGRRHVGYLRLRLNTVGARPDHTTQDCLVLREHWSRVHAHVRLAIVATVGKCHVILLLMV